MGFIENVNNLVGISEDVSTVAHSIDDVHIYSKTYIGPSDTPPTTRYDGTDLQPGDLYFNTNFNEFYVWNGITWQNSPGGQYADKNKGIGYMAQHSDENETINIPDNVNAYSVDSYTIEDGAELVIPDNSVYKIL